MCWKYKNPYNTVFIKCDIANNKSYGASYLRTFTDGIDDYYSNYEYCSYCGRKLEVLNIKRGGKNE